MHQMRTSDATQARRYAFGLVLTAHECSCGPTFVPSVRLRGPVPWVAGPAAGAAWLSPVSSSAPAPAATVRDGARPARAASPVSGGRSYPRTSSRDFEKGGSIAYRLSYAVFLPRHARIDLRPSATPAGHHGPTRDGAEAGGPRRGATYCTARGYLYIRPIYAPRRSRRPTRLSRDDYRTGQDYTFLIDTRTRWPFPRISRACLRR